jgi:DNA-binding transcriptional LysR family regulator
MAVCQIRKDDNDVISKSILLSGRCRRTQHHTLCRKAFYLSATLSEHIAKLEKEYNIKLFNRKRDISLTYAGKCMVDSVSRILAIEREMKNRFEDIRQEKGGEISIGLSVSRSQTLLPLAIPKFTQMYPNADLHVEIQSNSILKKHLFDGTVDIAVGFYDNFDTAQIHSMPAYGTPLPCGAGPYAPLFLGRTPSHDSRSQSGCRHKTFCQLPF